MTSCTVGSNGGGLSESKSPRRGGTALSWDPENRLLAYNNVLTAGYRGDGLRAWKQTAGGRTYFLYDGINIVCELDNDGDLLAESVFGAAGLLSRGNVQYQFDPLGDAVHQLDGSGNVTANRLFDAWGNELTSGTGPHGYRAKYGYYADSETGLVALAFRYYAPGVGRFLNRDPALHSDGPGLYRYGANGPVLTTDAAGLHASQSDCESGCGRCTGKWFVDLGWGAVASAAIGCMAGLILQYGFKVPGGAALGCFAGLVVAGFCALAMLATVLLYLPACRLGCVMRIYPNAYRDDCA